MDSISIKLINLQTKFELKENLEQFLIYGSYPEVITAKTKLPKEFIETYPNSELKIITKENYLDFIT